jgi:hypothetical protein
MAPHDIKNSSSPPFVSKPVSPTHPSPRTPYITEGGGQQEGGGEGMKQVVADLSPPQPTWQEGEGGDISPSDPAPAGGVALTRRRI